MIQSTRNTVNHPLLTQPQLATDGRLKTSTIPNINWFGRRVKTQLELIQTDSIECSSPFTQKPKSPLHLQNNAEKEVDLIQSHHHKSNLFITRSHLEALSVHPC